MSETRHTRFFKICKQYTKHVFLVITILWAILSLCLLLIQMNTKHIILINFLGLHLTKTHLFCILFLMIIGWGIWGLGHAWSKSTQKIMKFIMIVGWFVLATSFLFVTLIMLYAQVITKHYEFASPDTSQSFIVNETSYTKITLYQRVNPFFIESLDASLEPRDVYMPIENNNYKLTWDKSRVTLMVNLDGKQTWGTVHVNLGTNARNIMYEFTYPEKELPALEGNSAESSNVNNVLTLDTKETTLQASLDALSIDKTIKIADSNYGIVEVDRAMARSFWYFVKIENEKLIFISEAPSTSPSVEGSVDAGGVIYLKFKDIHERVNSYKSIDNGVSWVEI